MAVWGRACGREDESEAGGVRRHGMSRVIAVPRVCALVAWATTRGGGVEVHPPGEVRHAHGRTLRKDLHGPQLRPREPSDAFRARFAAGESLYKPPGRRKVTRGPREE